MSEWKRISSLANVRRGASPRPIGDPSYFGGDVGWVRISDVTRSSRFLRETEQYVSPLGESMSVRVNPGDLVMSICGTLGRPIIIDIPACIHDGFVQFTNLKDVDPVFLFYTLQFSGTKFNGMGQPGTQTNLNTTLVGRLEIFAPQLATQRRIAEILTTLDEEIEATEALIAKHQQIKAGLMHDLFTRGLWTRAELDRGDHKGLPSEASAKAGSLRPTPEEAPGLYQETPLGLIPKVWKLESCSDLCVTIIDCKNRTPPLTEDGHAVIRTPNVRNGEFVCFDLNYTDPKSYEIWTARGRPQSGDIVITREAPVGEVCMIPDDLHAPCLGQRMMLYRPNSERIYPLFMLHGLQSRRIQKFLDVISGGSTVGHVRVGDIRSLRLPCPEIVEQQTIAGVVEGAAENLRIQTTHVAKLRQQKQGLMHDLLTGRVRVDLSANNNYSSP